VKVAAIMPVRGRPEQTVEAVRRLLATAGYDDWSLTCIGGDAERETLLACSRAGAKVRHVIGTPRLTYWQALAYETRLTDAQLLCGLASDLKPGMHWLARGVAAYREAFPGEHDYGLLGFNGDSHPVGHSCHFLIDTDLLTYLGGWPVWYDHNFGDTELCQRAIALGFYAKAPWALLFHDHPYFGGTDDAVYAEGRAQVSRDQALYERRRAAGWPTISR
jgi:hypothetical protein